MLSQSHSRHSFMCTLASLKEAGMKRKFWERGHCANKLCHIFQYFNAIISLLTLTGTLKHLDDAIRDLRNCILLATVWNFELWHFQRFHFCFTWTHVTFYLMINYCVCVCVCRCSPLTTWCMFLPKQIRSNTLPSSMLTSKQPLVALTVFPASVYLKMLDYMD